MDDIWLYIVGQSGSVDTATRVVQNISDRFWLLGQYPRMGRAREDLSPALRSFPVGDYVVLYSLESDETVLVHHVMHGRRDIDSVFHR